VTSLLSGLASISARLDDSPNVRGAVGFGRMVREQSEFSTLHDLEIREGDDGVTVARKFRATLAHVKAVVSALRDEQSPNTLGSAIDRHAWHVIRGAYRSRDTRFGA